MTAQPIILIKKVKIGANKKRNRFELEGSTVSLEIVLSHRPWAVTSQKAD